MLHISDPPLHLYLQFSRFQRLYTLLIQDTGCMSTDLDIWIGLKRR